jgi:uncharacterized metal-binding protein
MISLNVLKVLKVGIVSCSGEAIPGGTISRIACRQVLDELRPGKTVTICLPLFIAGGSEERKFAAEYPTITVDGCEKYCARKSTEKLSGKPARALLIPEILKKYGIDTPKSLRNLSPEEKAAVQTVVYEIAQTVDEVLGA